MIVNNWQGSTVSRGTVSDTIPSELRNTIHPELRPDSHLDPNRKSVNQRKAAKAARLQITSWVGDPTPMCAIFNRY